VNHGSLTNIEQTKAKNCVRRTGRRKRTLKKRRRMKMTTRRLAKLLVRRKRRRKSHLAADFKTKLSCSD